MDKLHLSQKEEDELLTILERYLPDLKHEIANTDRKEFRKELQEREVFMQNSSVACNTDRLVAQTLSDSERVQENSFQAIFLRVLFCVHISVFMTNN